LKSEIIKKEDGNRRMKTGNGKKVENGKGKKYGKIHSWNFIIIVSIQEKQK
tara:strand:- start:189 stop:341 length:153 start_codon:yes stop_codon:yes gene_type:complete